MTLLQFLGDLTYLQALDTCNRRLSQIFVLLSQLSLIKPINLRLSQIFVLLLLKHMLWVLIREALLMSTHNIFVVVFFLFLFFFFVLFFFLFCFFLEI